MTIFEEGGGFMRLGQWGSYVRNWIFDNKVHRDLARRWLKERVNRKPSIKDKEGVFKIEHFREWLNKVFLYGLFGRDDCDPGPTAVPGINEEEGVRKKKCTI